MKTVYEDYLFDKNILVCKGNGENCAEVAFTLANKFGICVKKGTDKLNLEALAICERNLVLTMPDAFYRGFPDSVRTLTKVQRLLDAIINYSITYGLEDFSSPQHSVFEETLDKVAFNENFTPQNFSAVDTATALSLVREFYADLLKSTRPLNGSQMEFVLACARDFGYYGDCSSRNTKVRLLAGTRNLDYADYISLSDCITLVEVIGEGSNYGNAYNCASAIDIRLGCADRKFLTKVIDRIFLCNQKVNVRDCYEKQAVWCGLLHQIHYKPCCEKAKEFVCGIRSGKNLSVYAEFEALMNKDVVSAAGCLLKNKGASALLRNLDYLLSRAKEGQIDEILSMIDTKNSIVLMQLIWKYNTVRQSARTFVFSKNNLLKSYTETDEEAENSKTILPETVTKRVLATLTANYRKLFKGKLNKVYVDEQMKNVALPLSENTSFGGTGILPKGSIVPIPKCKVIRLFAYWEKVNDIDLSCMGITENGRRIEFSWRTMHNRKQNAVCYSGDQTAGFDGGTEYFDVNLDMLRRDYPDMKYLIVNNNVFSKETFASCYCKAGYMVRSAVSSGEVYEPKTVKTSFTINCQSSFCHLFAFDAQRNCIIWLNAANSAMQNVAGESNFNFLQKYFRITEVLNVYDFFTTCASKKVTKPEEADIVVIDGDYTPSQNQVVITSADTEKIMAYMNGVFN